MIEAVAQGPNTLQTLQYLGWKRELLPLTERCFRDFGPNVPLRLFGVDAFLTSDANLIDELFVKRANVIGKWQTGPFELVLGQGLLTADGNLWKEQRRRIQPMFNADKVEEYGALFAARAKRTAMELASQRSFDLERAMLSAALGIAADSLFGKDATTIDDVMHRSQSEILDLFEHSLSTIPIPLAIPTPGNLRMKRAVRAMDEALAGLIDVRRKSPPQRDLLGALLEQHQGTSALVRKQLRDECMTMILASHETMARMLIWTIYLLAVHTDEQQLARQKLCDAGDAPITTDSHPFLDAILMESMRLYPPVWGIGRTANEDFPLGPYNIRQGTYIFAIPYATHRQESLYPEPLEFRPSRWPNGFRDASKTPRGSYIPFGAGPRKCIGLRFSMLSAKLQLAEMLRQMCWSTDVRHPKLKAMVTLGPRDRIPIDVHSIAAQQAP